MMRARNRSSSHLDLCRRRFCGERASPTRIILFRHRVASHTTIRMHHAENTKYSAGELEYTCERYYLAGKNVDASIIHSYRIVMDYESATTRCCFSTADLSYHFPFGSSTMFLENLDVTARAGPAQRYNIFCSESYSIRCAIINYGQKLSRTV